MFTHFWLDKTFSSVTLIQLLTLFVKVKLIKLFCHWYSLVVIIEELQWKIYLFHIIYNFLPLPCSFMLTVKSPFNWSLMTPSTELRLGSKDFAFFSFSNALELGSTLSGLKRTIDNWSQILMNYSMEEVPETISSIVSSE